MGAPAEQDAIDQAALRRLLEIIGGDREDLVELFEEFEDATPALMDKMSAAAAASDYTTLRIASHSLESNARDFGAVTLAKLCEQLEHACREGTVSDAPAQVDAIRSQLEVATVALRSLVEPDE